MKEMLMQRTLEKFLLVTMITDEFTLVLAVL
jgi:hypothetical protein